MKKILIAANSLNLGGIETSLVNLIKKMDSNKYDITLVLEKKEGMFLNDLPSNIDVKEYKISKSKNLILRKISNFTNRIKWIYFNYNKYDASICYATYSLPCGFLARTSSKNKILFVHSDYYRQLNCNRKRVKKYFLKLKIKRYNHIIFVSNEARKEIEKIFPDIKKKMLTINNLIDEKRIIKLSEEKINDIEKKVSTFLFIGRLDEKQKNVSRIIEIANVLRKETVEFWLVGDGPDRTKYEEQIKKYNLNNIKILGAKKNPYPYLKLCDYLLLTSNYEGFPVVYNESIILKKPILTTVNVSDDYITIPNRFGIICSIDISEICNKIKDLLKKGYLIYENVDYEKLNNKRISEIEKILNKK